MDLIITGIYASILAIVFFVLTIRVIAFRRRNSVSLGTGNSGQLEKYIRAHANFSEYVPISLILLAIAETNTIYTVYLPLDGEAGANASVMVYLHICGITLVVGRLFHAYAIISKENASWQRIAGMMCTFAVMLSLAIWNLLSIFIFND